MARRIPVRVSLAGLLLALAGLHQPAAMACEAVLKKIGCEAGKTCTKTVSVCPLASPRVRLLCPNSYKPSQVSHTRNGDIWHFSPGDSYSQQGTSGRFWAEYLISNKSAGDAHFKVTFTCLPCKFGAPRRMGVDNLGTFCE